jgi:nucleoside-triphosphatase THEP1
MHRNVHIITKLEPETVIGSRPDIWILTGERDSGKTTQIKGWVAGNTAKGMRTTGVFSDKVLMDGTVAGYDVVEIAGGERHPAIRVFPSARSRIVGRFYFDTEGFNQVNAAVLSAPPGDVAVLDEIGLAEMKYREGLYPALLHFVRGETPLLLCVRNEVVDDVCELLQSYTDVPESS